jgi:ribosomal protein L35AE/L33A
MSWNTIKRNSIGEGVPSVKVGAVLREKHTTFSQVTLLLSKSIAQHIQVRGGDRIELAIGTLADKGWMRVMKGNEQLARAHGHEGAVQIRFSGRRLGVMESHKIEAVKYKTGTNSKPYVLFMLPKWARLEEVSSGPR